MSRPRVTLGGHQIRKALEKAGWSVGIAATLLGVSRQTLQRRLEEFPHLKISPQERHVYLRDLVEIAILNELRRGNMKFVRKYADSHGQSRGYGRISAPPEVRKMTRAEFKQALKELELAFMQTAESDAQVSGS